MRWFRFLLIAGLLAAALLALWPHVRSRIPSALAGFWRQQIMRAPDDQVPRLLLELTSLGDDAVPVLVQLIGCQRAAVSRPARMVLTQEVDRWLTTSPDEAAPHLAVLAKALAANVTDFGPAGREFTEDLIDRMMAAALNGRPLLPVAALPDCEYVLQVAVADHRLKWAQRDPNSAEAEKVLPPFENSPAADEPSEAEQIPQTARMQPADNRVTLRAAVEANSAEPLRVLPSLPDAEAIPPERLDLEADPLRELPEMPAPRPHAEFRPTRLEQPIETKPARTGGVRQAEDADAQISAWMHQLHSSDKIIVEHAEAHLAEAGFGPGQLDLARRLTSPDPLVREQLADILPQVPGIDAKTWLIWLSRDPRADVRLAAISVMATIDDPILLKRIREMARNDPDHRIQEQGQRLLNSSMARRK